MIKVLIVRFVDKVFLIFVLIVIFIVVFVVLFWWFLIKYNVILVS